MVDLESTVAPSSKRQARDAALSYLRQHPEPDLVRILRINSPRTADGLRDLLALHETRYLPDAIVIPKCQSADEIGMVTDVLEETGSTTGIIPMVELARGVFAAVDANRTRTPVLNGKAIEPAMVREANRAMAVAARAGME